MFKQALTSLLQISALFIGDVSEAQPVTEIVERADIRFQPLNPARGDASPQAGVLWGDIEEDVASGALIVFADGFSSPPHIHNITYRAIVISGAVHNDDPDAERSFMGPGSFWIQPAGESHITAAASGNKGTAFLEIMEGPYLVKPSESAFDNGERPLNIDARDMVWLDASDVSWVDQPATTGVAGRPAIAFLWGTPQPGQKNGSMIKIAADTNGELRGNDAWLRGVVIQGQIDHRLSADSNARKLEPGSYFGSTDSATHEIACTTKGSGSFSASEQMNLTPYSIRASHRVQQNLRTVGRTDRGSRDGKAKKARILECHG